MTLARMEEYNWDKVGGKPEGEWASFATLVLPQVYADVCTQEQLMANTVQNWRLVALVDENKNVLKYTKCEPNPYSPHRVR